MHTVALLLSRTVLAAIGIIEICMFARAILSFFADPESVLLTFCIAVTEPVILPFRAIFSRFESLDQLPFDIPFLATWIALAALGGLLPTVT